MREKDYSDGMTQQQIADVLGVSRNAVQQMERNIIRKIQRAIRKIGGKRATSVHDTQEDAEKKMEELGKGYELEVRPGSRTRCENFCLVRDHCDQWNSFNQGE